MNPNSGNWDVGSNWSGGVAPGLGDTAVINTAATATITIQSSDFISVQSITTASNDTLSITGPINGGAGGALEVTAGNSTLSGALSMTGGSLTATGSGVTFTANGATAVSAADLYAYGAVLSLPGLTSYTSRDNTFEAAGRGGVLDVSALTTQNQSSGWIIVAQSGGEVKLTALTSTYGFVSVFDTGNSTLLDPNLTTPNGFIITLDGTDAQVANSWTAFTHGDLTVTGGSLTLPGLTDVDGSHLSVQNGGALALPGLTRLTNPDVATTTFEAYGRGSVLDVSALTTLTQLTYLDVVAQSGGEVKLTGLTSLSTQQFISVIDTGNSTLLDPNLTTLNGVRVTLDGTDAQVANSWTTFINGTLAITGGSLTLPGLNDYANSTLRLSGGAALSLPVLAQGNITLTNGTSVTVRGALVSMPAAGTSGATINVPGFAGVIFTLDNSGILTGSTVNVGAGATVDLSGGTYTGATTFNVGQGSNVVLSGGTYLGGAAFNVAQGAIVDLTGGTYGGTLTGSGSGTVQFSSGLVFPAVGGGLTLDFPGAMFQWTGGGFDSTSGDLVNLGTMNLAGPNNKLFYAAGTFDNFGTIIETGAGSLVMFSNLSDALKNEVGATYLLESDAGISYAASPGEVIDNAGTIRKTAGAGVSTIASNGALTNTGVIEVDSGTLALAPISFAQLSGTALTGGTWNALNGATLAFPNGTSITSNQANISLSGAGATFTGIAGLSSNSGSFSITNGAGFTTAGDLSNSGSLTVGGGSTLTVKGAYTQTSAAALNDPFSGGQSGEVAVQGAANLAGNFNVSLDSGFTPNRNTVYPVMTFGSHSGTFAAVTGLGAYLTEQLNPTSLNLVNGTGNPAALQLSQVAAPTTATTGRQIMVTWQVSNPSGNAASGSWQDSVFLSTTPAITSSSLLLGSVTHSGGLAAGGSYNASLTAAVPALPPGNYFAIVQADSLDQVLVLNRAGATLVAGTGQLAVSVPAVTVGTPANGSFTAADQDQYFQVVVPAGGTLQVALASAASSGAVALYVSQGTEPTPYNFQEAADVANQPNQTLTVPQVLTAGTYYILAHSVSGNAATAGYTLTVTQGSALSVSGISSYSGGNAGNVTVEIDGANFSSAASASLTLGGAVVNATAVDFANASQLFATFNLTGAAVGGYTLTVKQGALSATAATPFQVVAAKPASLNVMLITPQFIRSGRTGTIVVTYTNTTNNDMVAPLLDVASTNTSVFFSTPDDPNNYTQDAQVLAVAPSGPASCGPARAASSR
ncbi:MAG TPA: hypothetical protein DDY78_12610 [Planctomycetales bacterium]|nr:hypothetical protein [Planctomycetales bacterium]